MVNQKRVVTFVIRGGEPFEIKAKGNPPGLHNGNVTVLPLLCTEVEKEHIEKFIISQGAMVSTKSLEAPREDTPRLSLPCEECGLCPWLDIELDGLCGAGFNNNVGWHPTVKDKMREDATFLEKERECPLQPAQKILSSN